MLISQSNLPQLLEQFHKARDYDLLFKIVIWSELVSRVKILVWHPINCQVKYNMSNLNWFLKNRTELKCYQG